MGSVQTCLPTPGLPTLNHAKEVSALVFPLPKQWPLIDSGTWGVSAVR